MGTLRELQGWGYPGGLVRGPPWSRSAALATPGPRAPACSSPELRSGTPQCSQGSESHTVPGPLRGEGGWAGAACFVVQDPSHIKVSLGHWADFIS